MSLCVESLMCGPVCVWVGLVLVGFAVCDCVLVPCATVCSSCVSLCVSRLPPVFLNRYVCTSNMKSLDSDLHVGIPVGARQNLAWLWRLPITVKDLTLGSMCLRPAWQVAM